MQIQKKKKKLFNIFNVCFYLFDDHEIDLRLFFYICKV